MRQSKYFLKTSKTSAAGESNISSRLLKQAGFIAESVAGRYFFLPLGHAVQQRIMQVVKEEMDGVGAQEMIAPTLHPLELWQETNRTNTTGFELMQVKDRRGAKFALGGTAEEMFVDVVRKFQLSYKDLPFQLYQFSNKFRDELRARGGLLRVREFIMKDGYSFHASAEDFKQTYETMKQVYLRIFKRLGLTAVVVEADNGYIGGEYCHEFIVNSEAGESRYFATPDGSYAAHEDVAQFERQPANAEAEVLPLQTVDQPEWVKTMEDNSKHYGKPLNHYLKNVVYKNRVTGQMVIATLTGELEVNQTKLEQVTCMVGQLDEASDADLKLLGTEPGYVHSWGYNADVLTVGDIVLEKAKNLIGGQKTPTTDTINVNYGRDFTCSVIADIALAQPGSIAPNGQSLAEYTGIEVGNIFQLGYHYSKLMSGAVFTAEDGSQQPYYMGCYGIGIGRTMATIIEKSHDERGMIWPNSVAPFAVHLISLPGKEGAVVTAAADDIYTQLQAAGVAVLYDDRLDKTAGEKFGDSDLIGLPLRVVVSNKTLAAGSFEVKLRTANTPEHLQLSEIINRAQSVHMAESAPSIGSTR